MVNWAKSSVYFGKRILNSRQNYIVSTIGMRMGSIPFFVAGVPLFFDAPKLAYFHNILDKIMARFPV